MNVPLLMDLVPLKELRSMNGLGLLMGLKLEVVGRIPGAERLLFGDVRGCVIAAAESTLR